MSDLQLIALADFQSAMQRLADSTQALRQRIESPPFRDRFPAYMTRETSLELIEAGRRMRREREVERCMADLQRKLEVWRERERLEPLRERLREEYAAGFDTRA